MTDVSQLSDADLARIEQAIAARRLHEAAILPQWPEPDPESFSGRVLARQRAVAEAIRREHEAREAALRRAREEHDEAERRRVAVGAEQAAKLRAEVARLEEECRPLRARLWPVEQRLAEARREIAELTTVQPWNEEAARATLEHAIPGARTIRPANCGYSYPSGRF